MPRIMSWCIKGGKDSFCIYLLHMPIAGVVANVLNRSEVFALLNFVRPLIVILLVQIVVWFIHKITNNNRTINLLIGVR